MGLQVYRRRAAGVWEHSGASAQLRRSLVVPSGAPWVLLFLLAVVALACLRLAHFHPGALAHLHLRPPRMPRRRVGLALEPHSSALPADSWAAKAGSNGPHYSGADKTLSFAVCGGFAQQRVALLSGLVLAVELNRTVVLPRLLFDGFPPVGHSNASVAFGSMLNVEHFAEHMRMLGIAVVRDPPDPAITFALQLGRLYNPMKALQMKHAQKQHLRVDCPALKVPAALMVKHEELVFAAMNAMQASSRLLDIIRMVEGHLQGLSDTNAYNVLRLRTEDEWITYCSRWQKSNADGLRVHDNCLNNTRVIGEQLRLHRIDPQVPLIVSTSVSRTGSSLLQEALGNLQLHNYKVVLRDDILDRNLKLPVLSREEVALVDYYLALGCQQFVGNSVSVFSALLIMERWHAGRFATYYNGGNIPLEAFMPLYQMPWVFTYNDWSAGTEYDYMVKAAVTSGIEVARMKPYCMYSGSTSAEMYQWFLSKGVTIIQHEPAWRDALVKEGARNKELNLVHSHLYKTGGTLVGTFQRIDIPILRQFDQYNYVLFTDCDVYFRQQMKLVDWGTPLPTAVGMGFEGQDIFPYNAGIMLMNMPYMRKTNKKFLNWIVSQKNGLYYPGYGPLDQGALNQFYEKQIKGKPISKNFNAMMFHQFRPDARIVHMNGPKPNHYLDWLDKGRCAFGDMCKMGLSNGVCQYVAEYVRFTPYWDVPAKLHKLCSSGLATKQVPDTTRGHAAALPVRLAIVHPEDDTGVEDEEVEEVEAAMRDEEDEDGSRGSMEVDQEAVVRQVAKRLPVRARKPISRESKRSRPALSDK